MTKDTKSDLPRLRKGVAAWNAWRRENSSVVPNLVKSDLREANLSEANLRGANLRGANLVGANLKQTNLKQTNLRGANLVGANLMQADLSEAKLRQADLRGANLVGANLMQADLSEAKLRHADLSGAKLRQADLREADLRDASLISANLNEADLSGANLNEADLSGANLQGANLVGANLVGANLEQTNLRGANLVGANLRGANLNEANLRGANLNEANLRRAYLNEADLRGANLVETNLTEAHLTQADLSRASLNHCELGGLDLAQIKGLEFVAHRGPSHVGTSTLIRTAERLARDASNRGGVEAFFRGCGVEDEWIHQFRAFIGHPIEFYSCFVSYAHADRGFARRIHDGLQGRGIRCWLDEHQLLPGDDIKDHIDQGIRLWDKVLLCCSEASLASWWVEKELDKALEKEERLSKERKQKVFAIVPILLDKALASWEDGRASMVRNRLGADFTGWEQSTARFDEQFERVLKALRTGDGGREKPPEPKL